MARKKLVTTLKLQLPAGQATPAPPVGTALGPHGVNLMEFVKAYNDMTGSQRGQIIPVEISIFEDRSFTFITKTPPTSFFLKRAAKLEKGTGTTGREIVGRVTMKQVREIAELKMADLNAYDVEKAAEMIKGSARSMGIEVVG